MHKLLGTTKKQTSSGCMTIKFIPALFLAVFMVLHTGSLSSFAAVSWCSMSEDTTAEAAIVMDIDSGAVLWGKNINTQYTPASITKLMTALVVLEHCDLSDEVSVASEAVDELEYGASTIGLAAGDVLTVDELLHAMLLRSANDAANALACHVSGSIEEFAKEMTRRAEQIGCQQTIFRNPSGLTTPENVTTAYDMALIGAECVRTPGFLEVESRLSYAISGDSKYPDGFTVHQEHKMLLNNTAYSDSRVIGGKTGYIKASGNTLVTMAEDNGLRLVAVVLKDKNPAHYKDTEKLLNFGFDNFESITVTDPVSEYKVAERLLGDKIIDTPSEDFYAEGETKLTIPKGANIGDITVSYDYNIDNNAPEQTIAKMIFRYDGVDIGSTLVLDGRVSDLSVIETKESHEAFKGLPVTKVIIIGIACILLLAVCTLMLINASRNKAAREQRQRRLARRKRRLMELNVSEEEFMDMVRNEQNHPQSHAKRRR